MGVTDATRHGRPVSIVPYPDTAPSSGFDGNSSPPQSPKPYTCLTCARRKVKCNKATPICSSCHKSKLQCLYQAPLSRPRKRYVNDDVEEKLARYELILKRHGLLPNDTGALPFIEKTTNESVSLSATETGKLVGGQGRSRYVKSHLWYNLGDDEMSDDDEEAQVGIDIERNLGSDPLTGAFMGSQQSLVLYHPSNMEAMMMWKTYTENVNPLCKILHIPSTFMMVKMASQEPAAVSKSNECLLFAVYHFAVFSMTEADCEKAFGESRATLMQKYHFATRQALVNAAFLKTTEMAVLQALVLFLLPCRYFYDPHTFWILTGVAVRIAQRMGLHRDGGQLGLLPFDVQMRRRLFYQLVPLDLIASQMSGTGIGIMPGTWDTQQPYNIDDHQIWPGMTEAPKEQEGATEMIFCLARSCIGTAFAKAGMLMDGGPGGFKVEPVIKEVENMVEEKYLRYCDIVNPLHFLTAISVRSAISATRLRVRLPKVKNQTTTEAESRELFQLSQKIIDTDIAAYAQANLRKYYRWHMTSFFLWGSWDSLIFILISLRRSGFLPTAETDAAWSRVEQVYKNHDELLESKRALPVAVRRLTLKAWDANPASSNMPEPAFIVALRSMQKRKLKSQTKMDSNTTALSSSIGIELSEPNPLLGNPSDGIDLDLGNDFNIDETDWMFWDQLIKNNQATNDPHQAGLS